MEKDTQLRLLKKITKSFQTHYGCPRLSNKYNPLDELVFIVLTIKTHEKNYQGTYLNIRRAFYPWSKILDSSVNVIQNHISSGGLGRQKAERLKSAMIKIYKDNGKLSLNFLKKFNDEECEEYLTSLPGVGIKAARCIMLYSLGRKVFPVDVNTVRIFKRIGLIENYIDYKREWVHDFIQEMVPSDLRHQLHVGSVIHGRTYCLPKIPKCIECIINKECYFYKQLKEAQGVARG